MEYPEYVEDALKWAYCELTDRNSIEGLAKDKDYHVWRSNILAKAAPTLKPGMSLFPMYDLPGINIKDLQLFQDLMRKRAQLHDPSEGKQQQLTPNEILMFIQSHVGKLAEVWLNQGKQFHEKLQQSQELALDFALMAMMIHAFCASIKIDWGDGKLQNSMNN